MVRFHVADVVAEPIDVDQEDVRIRRDRECLLRSVLVRARGRGVCVVFHAVIVNSPRA